MSVEAYLAGIDLAVDHVLTEDGDEGDEAEATGNQAVAEVEAAESPQQMTSVENSDGGRTVDGGGRPLGPALVPFSPAYENAPAETPNALRGRVLKSEIPGIADQKWTDFALALKTAAPGAVSASNALGMFELRPRRLEDLGLMRKMVCTRSPTGRMVWVGEFIPPMTQKDFLKSPKEQYKALGDSMRKYVEGLRDGSIPRPDGGRPDGMTLSGALAILHRCGPSGLKTWNTKPRFEDTVALYEKTNGIF